MHLRGISPPIHRDIFQFSKICRGISLYLDSLKHSFKPLFSRTFSIKRARSLALLQTEEAYSMENTTGGQASYFSQSRAESLKRAVHGQSFSNFPAIFRGFAAKGIPESEIKPRENVFTFEAWKALGRVVRRGEHGVKVVTFIETKSKEIDQDTGERKVIRRPWTTTVFHISQTEVITGGAR
jgi:hypothetical protein